MTTIRGANINEAVSSMDHPLHVPVLMEEVLASFAELQLTTFVDGTLGMGGHAKRLLEAHPELNQLVGFDQDPHALDQAKGVLPEERTIFVHANFSELDQQLDKLGLTEVDGILIDLGVSSMQLDFPERGFSFARSGPLDMRMNPTQDLTAAVIVNTWSEQAIADMLYQLGELTQSRRLAHVIVQERQQCPFETTEQLISVLRPHLHRPRGKKIHPATLLFQALRMAVNDELGALEAFLPQATDRLRSGGRLAVIAFHSLEDRVVKRHFQEVSQGWADDPTDPFSGRKAVPVLAKIRTRKPVLPSEQEVLRNSRSRSARLRVIEKL